MNSNKRTWSPDLGFIVACDEAGAESFSEGMQIFMDQKAEDMMKQL